MSRISAVQGVPEGRRKLLLFWTATPFVIFWLPLVRSVMDGVSYQWGVAWGPWQLSGAGLQGDLWYLVLGTAFGIALLWSGWRGAGPFFRWGVAGWFLILLARGIHSALTNPEALMFHGDTLGIHVNLTWVVPGFHLAGLLIYGYWLKGWDARGRPSAVAPWGRANAGRLVILLSLLPIQFALLRFGDPHGRADALGVILTIAQWYALGWALVPREEWASIRALRSSEKGNSAPFAS